MSYKKVKQELQCVVCRDMPTVPSVLNCCDGIICGDCASRYFQGNPKPCPKCRHDILSLDDSLRKSRIVDNLIKTAVEETCENIGCEEKICLEEKVSHKATCKFELVTCLSRDCEHEAMRKSMRSHERSCPYLPVECRQCKAKVPRQDMSSHIQDDCPRTVAPCTECAENTRRSLMQEHLDSTCPEVAVACEGGCGEQVKRRGMKEHVEGSVLAYSLPKQTEGA